MATTKTGTLEISSSAFQQEGAIPEKYTVDGEAINPALTIGQLPEGIRSLAIIMADPDTSKGTFDHWLVWNIEPVTEIEENTSKGVTGMNSAGKTGYYPPAPPTGSHRYYFYVYALDDMLHLQAGSNKKALLEEIEKHLIARGILMGRYERTNK